MTPTGVRRAARSGVGIAFGQSKWRRGAPWDAHDRAFGYGSEEGHLQTLLDIYKDAGGTGPRIYTTYVFIGQPPAAIADGILQRAQADSTRTGTTPRTTRPLGLCAEDIIEDWINALATGMDCIDMRIPHQNMPLEIALEQLERIGQEVLPAFRQHTTT
jgi:hypothetical protein